MLSVHKLEELENLNSKEIELLLAVGIDRIEALSVSQGAVLLPQMRSANGMLRILPELPSEEVLKGWIDSAQTFMGLTEEELQAEMAQAPVVSQVAPVLEAITVSPKLLIESGITAQEVPAMTEFIEEAKSQTKSLVTQPVQEGAHEAHAKVAPYSANVQKANAAQVKLKPQFSLPDEAQLSEKSEIQPLEGRGSNLMNAPKAETNKGRDKHSRRYIRGVLHPDPPRVFTAAFITFVALFMFPISIAAMIMVVLQYSTWWVVVPIVNLVFAALYLIMSSGLKCRICGQPMFMAKRCLRHDKAHRIPLIGYILPTSLHMMIFKWFHCSYCGTAVRLKE